MSLCWTQPGVKSLNTSSNDSKTAAICVQICDCDDSSSTAKMLEDDLYFLDEASSATRLIIL